MKRQIITTALVGTTLLFGYKGCDKARHYVLEKQTLEEQVTALQQYAGQRMTMKFHLKQGAIIEYDFDPEKGYRTVKFGGLTQDDKYACFYVEIYRTEDVYQEFGGPVKECRLSSVGNFSLSEGETKDLCPIESSYLGRDGLTPSITVVNTNEDGTVDLEFMLK